MLVMLQFTCYLLKCYTYQGPYLTLVNAITNLEYIISHTTHLQQTDHTLQIPLMWNLEISRPEFGNVKCTKKAILIR